jgi:ketosteroid isomerase-like protein
MSQENVETVRRIFEAWGKGDFRATTEYFDANVVLVVGRGFPDPGTALGPDAVREFTIRFMQQWDHLTMSAEELRPIGDAVLVHTRQMGSGKASRVETEMTYFWLFNLQGGKIIRLESFRDEASALEALGLPE